MYQDQLCLLHLYDVTLMQMCISGVNWQCLFHWYTFPPTNKQARVIIQFSHYMLMTIPWFMLLTSKDYRRETQTEMKTFQDWMHCITENTQEFQIIQKVLLANKIDLSPELHRISRQGPIT